MERRVPVIKDKLCSTALSHNCTVIYRDTIVKKCMSECKNWHLKGNELLFSTGFHCYLNPAWVSIFTYFGLKNLFIFLDIFFWFNEQSASIMIERGTNPLFSVFFSKELVHGLMGFKFIHLFLIFNSKISLDSYF